jgi:hypothetical protein
MREIGIAKDYASLLDLLRQRADELQLSRLTIDHATGVADGYSAKALAGIKRYGPVSLGPTLEVLDLVLIVAEAGDPAAIERLARLPKRLERNVRRRGS